MEWHSVKVIHGFRNGRKFGFPTANLSGESIKSINVGVYAVIVRYNDILYKGMLYVGTRPTLNLIKTTYEIHILNFCGDIYGKNLDFKVIRHLRNECRFDSIHQLIQQLELDLRNTDLYVKLPKSQKQ